MLVGLGSVQRFLGVKERDGLHPLDSRIMNAAEKEFQLDKGAAMFFGLKKFHKYMFGRRFITVAVHEPLLTLFGEEKQVPALVFPWIQRRALATSTQSVQYRPGKEHISGCRLFLKATTACYRCFRS